MIAVTGATGNVGRALVRVLTEAGEDVTAVSRGTATMALPDGVRHQRADLADPGSLRPALAGAVVLFLMAPGNDLDPRGVVSRSGRPVAPVETGVAPAALVPAVLRVGPGGEGARGGDRLVVPEFGRSLETLGDTFVSLLTS